MSLIQKLDQIQEYGKNLIRTWWRPITCVGIAGSVIVHGTIIPFINNTATDLNGLAALITAAAAAFAVREWGKVQGNDSDSGSGSS